MTKFRAPLLAPPLAVGDTIGFFSSSAPVTVTAPNRFSRAKHFLQEKGFKLKAGKLTGKSDYYRSGTIQERVQEFNELIYDSKVRCIMSTIGGDNSNSLLPFIDYDALVADPKIIIGYSDTTALLAGIYAKTGLITFYGPALVPSFGEFPPLVNSTYKYFIEVLTRQQTSSYTYRLPDKWTDERLNWDEKKPVRPKKLYDNNYKFYGKGRVKGRVIGGNLNTLTGIWGSEWMPKIRCGDILFIEDSLKDIATVERLFSMLSLNGIFDKVSAILLGKHELFDNAGSGRKPYDVLIEVIGKRQLPIVDGFDCCHTHPMLTLPLGAEIVINFENKEISVVSNYLRELP
ncbi:LD-carboxypeptidase [Enterobacter pseudoroggenkampii]|uniref:S66 family peptidase n=1 Tax=Enterobacterales TaxID=91347 RepID=UPI000E0E4ECF|nr:MULTISPECIES: S66 peptidase family protein [Enterobacterales]NJQ21768.1 LD-carboxypeptidase [Pantoea sp. LS15]NKF48364.1 LD-carboxypeptidase [Pantoea sp. LS15]RDK12925.1 LD-carboxypeptidase [Enterobacter sp. 9-2]WJW94002.1 LD-carboxypeptidase [Enterobacter pseudoroggenkampii]